LIIKLSQPITIGKKRIKNRFVLAPMGTYLSNNGIVSEAQKRHYLRFAKGGAALLITESCYVDPRGNHGKNRLGVHHDGVIPKFRELTDLIHAQGPKIVLQLNHAGRLSPYEIIGTMPVSASSIPSPKFKVPPKALSKGEIAAITEAFILSAERGYKAGFDGVEIMAAGGYLINQFLSPETNIREDEYGGDLRGRSKFLLDIVRGTKELLGNEFLVLAKLQASRPADAGLTPEDAKRLAKMLEKAGVDSIHVAGDRREADEVDYEYVKRLAKLIKNSVTVPLSYAGGIKTLEDAASLLADGIADLAEIGRSLLADPEFPKKALSGMEKEIRPCSMCDHCKETVYKWLEIECSVNPEIGLKKSIRKGTDREENTNSH
jgi:2,4-dienoyl-CoA reductase-like NADH-dependent reductase (Old Yellow Enzyme family)